MRLPTADAVRASLYQDSLRDYIHAAWPLVDHHQFKCNWHIDAIAEHLEAVSSGEIRRLIINIPPRHMKSLAVGVFWPTWQWLKRPETQFMFASYAQRLTTRDSLKCRRLIESTGGRREGGTLIERVGYKGLLELLGSSWVLTEDQREKMKFENTEFGYRMATSIGGTGTGEGGDILVIDDPHKADEAESDVQREEVIDWLDGTISSRFNDPSTGALVLVMQRLHEDDATGHLLEQGGYEHLCLPAEYEPDHPFVWPQDPRIEPGELLWPGHFGPDAIKELKIRLGSYRSAGQLQQRPAPAEGIMFKRKDFRYWRSESHFIGEVEQRLYVLAEDDGPRRVDKAPTPIFQTVDAAISEKTSADWTVCATWACTSIGDLILLDMQRRHFEEQQVIQFLASVNEEWGHVPMWIERFGAGRNPLLALRRMNCPVMQVPVEAGTQADKLTRALVAISVLEDHRLFFPFGAEWLREYEDELTMFPNAKHDDMVDATSYAARLVPIVQGRAGRQRTVPIEREMDRKPISAGVMDERF